MSAPGEFHTLLLLPNTPNETRFLKIHLTMDQNSYSRAKAFPVGDQTLFYNRADPISYTTWGDSFPATMARADMKSTEGRRGHRLQAQPAGPGCLGSNPASIPDMCASGRVLHLHNGGGHFSLLGGFKG